MFICGIGVVWSTIQGTLIWAAPGWMSFNQTTFTYGMAAGITLYFSNILFLEGLKRLDVSIGSTIYRLNTVGVVILSVLILNEPMTWLKGTGIVLAILCVLLLYETGDSVKIKQNHSSVFLLLLILASFLRACYGVIIKAGIVNRADPQSMIIFVALCWVFGGLMYARFKENRCRLDLKTSLYSGVSGVMVFLIVLFLTYGLQYGEAVIVIPIANMSFVVALGIAVIMGMEMLTLKKALSIVIAAVAITCLSVS